MKTYEFITVTIIFLVLLVAILIGGEINNSNDVQNTYNAEIIDAKRKGGVQLDFEDEDIQKIYPFNGAYPTNELAYLTKMKNVDRENMTNEFILRTAFAKVTKEDWADSYVGEGEPVEIDARILEKYIEDIFGKVEYTHEDFSNVDLSIDGATTMLYKNTYDEKKDIYIIELETGDGIEDSYIEEYKTTATQFGDKIEIVINPIYLDNIGQKKNKDGNNVFFYEVYSSYDFKTKEFKNKLTGEIETTIYNSTEEGKTEFVDEIKNISKNDLEKYTLTYRLNGKTNEFEFESLKFEE